MRERERERERDAIIMPRPAVICCTSFPFSALGRTAEDMSSIRLCGIGIAKISTFMGGVRRNGGPTVSRKRMKAALAWKTVYGPYVFKSTIKPIFSEVNNDFV
jgi:hypothetical protein